MPTLFTLTFQGTLEPAAAVPEPEAREISRHAFPLNPPRDAAVREGFRSYKLAPLSSGRLLASVVANRGDRDSYQRPVLRAHGALLDDTDLGGPARDLCAVWEALDQLPEEDAAFAHELENRSIASSEEAFGAFSETLARAPEFYAQLADALGEETVDLYSGGEPTTRDLRAAMGLLPASRLARLHLALGAEDSEYREPLLGFTGQAPPEEEKGFLGGLFGGKGKGESGVVVDLVGRRVRGHRGEGPRGLAHTLADSTPWPDGTGGLERYATLLRCLESPRSEPLTPFDAHPELARLRRAIADLEHLSEELSRWP